MTRSDVDFILYTLGETLCYAEADENCEMDGIPDIVSMAQTILLDFRKTIK